ncbi:TBC1 domain family member 5 homolog A-like [Gordionus sp. m RMFG-2023]|uniref:TBC1 domain family member 5 homolog A-like n=1 Tax=Gordionus sp. m RMFG-2023 TaxID=3053472 RepID=UPI0031FC73A6
MDEKLTLTHTQYVPKFPKLSGKLSETYLNLIETYFEGHIESDSSKIRTLLCSLPIEIVDQVTSICSKAQLKDFNIVFGAEESFHTFYFRISKLHKKCDFDNDTRMIEKLITCSLNDNIRRKLNKHKHEGLDKMMKLGVELDGSNIKPDVSDTNYVDNDKKLDKNKKFYNLNMDKIPCKSTFSNNENNSNDYERNNFKENNFNYNGRNIHKENFDFKKRNYNDFRPNYSASRNYQNNIFRDSEGNSRNFRNNQSSNNNSNYYGRNSINNAWQYNNNSNNYGRGTWQNNNYNGRNNSWSYNNQRNQSQYNNRYGYQYQSYNNNNNGENNAWKNYNQNINQRKPLQYNDVIKVTSIVT